MIYIIFTIVTVINIFNIALIANNKLAQTIKEKVLLFSYSLAELLFILFIFTTVEFTVTSLVLALGVIIIWLLSKAYICILNMNFENVEKEGSNVMEGNFDLEENINDEEIVDNTIEEKNILSEVTLNNEEKNVLSEVILNNKEIIDEVGNETTVSDVLSNDEEMIDDEDESTVNEVSFNNVEIKNKIEENIVEEQNRAGEVLFNADEIMDNTIKDEIKVISEVASDKLELTDIVGSSLNNQRNIISQNSISTLVDIVDNNEINKDEERRSRRRSLALKISKMQGDMQ